MSHAGWALQKAIYEALSDDAELLTLLGGVHIYDDAPQRTRFPYITFGRTVVRDWSTGTEDGSEHIVTLHVWSRIAGRSQVYEIMRVVRDRLHDQQLAVSGYALVNLRWEFSDARREPDGETYHGIVRYRAVLEQV